jgi:hypothetical protein
MVSPSVIKDVETIQKKGRMATIAPRIRMRYKINLPEFILKVKGCDSFTETFSMV